MHREEWKTTTVAGAENDGKTRRGSWWSPLDNLQPRRKAWKPECHKVDNLSGDHTYTAEEQRDPGECQGSADIVNYLVSRELPLDLTRAQKDNIMKEAKTYIWNEPYLWKQCADQVIRRCVESLVQ